MQKIDDLENMAEKSLKFTQDIIDKHGPRLAGDKSTQDVANILLHEYSRFCDHAEKEEFSVYPKSFLGWIRILCVMYIFSIIMHFLKLPLLAALAITLGLLIMIVQFFYYIAFIDKFFKKKTGVNVYGTIEPSGVPRKQVILSGHHDSAYIFNLLVHQPKLYALRVYGGLGFVILMFILSWLIWIIELFTTRNSYLGVIWSWISLVSLILVIQLWFFASNKGTNGAGDNLIASVLTIQVAEYFKKLKSQGKGLNNTRIIVASFDAEEAGLRGARNYCVNHKEDLMKIPTYVLNMDCLYKLDDLFFLTTDINGTVKLSESMADKCVSISKELGYEAVTRPIEFLTGGTDAGEFGKIGVEATCIVGMPWGNSNHLSVYHTPDDNVNTIEKKLIKAVINILINYTKSLDAEFQNNQK